MVRKKQKLMNDDFEDVVKYNENSLREVWNKKDDEIWSRYLNFK